LAKKISKNKFKNKKVLVVGLGVFSGGLATVRFFVSRGAQVTVTDLKPGDQLGESALESIALGAICHFGGHVEDDFREADVVVLNPAVKPGLSELKLIRSDCLVTTEMALFFRLCRAPIIGVTGSNGKSTTTALIAHILKTAGVELHLGGNIGNSLIDCVHEIRPDQTVVLELSSFQLYRLGKEMLSPQVAVLTNLTANHLDWHGSFKHYRDSKANIFRYQSSGDYSILNFDDEQSDFLRTIGRGETLGFSIRHKLPQGAWIEKDKIGLHIAGKTEWLDCLDKIPMPGDHNVSNVLAAATAARASGVGAEAIEAAIPSFTPLEHRLEMVRKVGGVTFINDSIATTPESVAVALDSSPEPKVLIAGGYDKKIPLDEFARAIVKKTKTVVLIGQTAGALKKLIKGVNAAEKPEVKMAGTFEEAFEMSVESASEGDIVLLSPGFASYDMFNNFAERGKLFKALVNGLQDVSHAQL